MAEGLPRSDLLDKVQENASAYEERWKGCSHSVLRTLKDDLDLGSDEIIIVSSTLARGAAVV